MFLRYILCAAAAYLLGSISTGVLLSRRLFHDDVRKHGSGGTGATNMLRTYRLKAALLTFAGDAAKAALAVLLGRYLAGFEGGCVAAVFAIVGHMWPLYFGFRGGKGIACTVGAIAVLYPHPAGAAGNPVGGAGAVQPMHFAWFHNSCAGADPGGSAVVPWAGG